MALDHFRCGQTLRNRFAEHDSHIVAERFGCRVDEEAEVSCAHLLNLQIILQYSMYVEDGNNAVHGIITRGKDTIEGIVGIMAQTSDGKINVS